jgi:hypothetical protein
LDGQIVLDIEVTNKRIIVESSACQRVCPGGQDDCVSATRKVGLHDGRAQRAVIIGCFAYAIRWIGVGQIRRVIYGIGAGNDWEAKDDEQQTDCCAARREAANQEEHIQMLRMPAQANLAFAIIRSALCQVKIIPRMGTINNWEVGTTAADH